MIMVHLGKSIFGTFEILRHDGTSWKINILALKIPTPTTAPANPLGGHEGAWGAAAQLCGDVSVFSRFSRLSIESYRKFWKARNSSFQTLRCVGSFFMVSKVLVTPGTKYPDRHWYRPSSLNIPKHR